MSLASKKLYDALPIPLQNVACSLYSWSLNSRRYDSAFDRELAEAEERLNWSADRLANYANERLQRFVMHAATTVPYYRRVFAEAGLDPATVRSVEDLAPLPILTKSEAVKQGDALRSEAVPKKQIMMTHTSGSTGAGFHFATTRTADREQWITWWRYYRMHGISRGTWSAAFLGPHVLPIDQSSPPFWRYDVAAHRIFFSAYHLSDANLPSYLTALRRWRPQWIQGRPSSLILLASYILDSGDDLDHEVRWVTCGTENLSAHQSELMTRAFGVRPVQHYGLAEAVANISEHPDERLVVDEDFAAVELLANGDSGSARIIGTNVTNYATPLIRYDTGDVASIGSTSFPRTVLSMDGRENDFIVLKDGRKIGAVNRIFEDCLKIREVQIRQRDPGAVLVLVVKRPNYSAEDEALLQANLHSCLGHDIDAEIRYVPEIEKTPSGKLRIVVSDADLPHQH